MSVSTKMPGLARLRSRPLARFCIALTFWFSVTAVVSASESAHHELEVAQASSSAAPIFCLGDDRSCGLHDHDGDDVAPHLHTSDIGLIGMPAVDAPTAVHQLVATSVPLPAFPAIEGLSQATPERPPRTTCI